MRKFRIGKDISFRWTILTNGEGVPLEGRDLRLAMTDPLKRLAMHLNLFLLHVRKVVQLNSRRLYR